MHILDPMLSVLITLHILYNVIKKLIKTLSLFLQGVPDKIVIGEIVSMLEDMQHVKSTHHTHAWSLDGEHHVLSTHVIVGKNTLKEDIISLKNQILNALEDFNFEHTTVEIEYNGFINIKCHCQMYKLSTKGKHK